MTDHKDFVQKWEEAWRDPAKKFPALFHPEGKLFQQGMKDPISRDQIPNHVAIILALMPDVRNKVRRWSATGDDVFIEWTGYGTVLGRQEIEWDGASRFTLRDGMILEEVAYFDSFPLRVIADPSLKRDDMFSEGMAQIKS